MMRNRLPSQRWLTRTALSLALLSMATAHAAQTTALASNLDQSSIDTLTAGAEQQLAASFITDQAYDLAAIWTATIAGSTSSGTATLLLYSSDAQGLVPDAALATFALSQDNGTTSTYSLSHVSLQAHTAYWLVLSNTTGQSTWAWTDSSTGQGTGFTGNWANSMDAGSTWFTNSNLYPLQASISVSSSVPEPASWALMLAGGVLMMGASTRHQSRRHPAPALPTNA